MELQPGAAATPDGELERIAWLPLEEALPGSSRSSRSAAMVERATEELAPGGRG